MNQAAVLASGYHTPVMMFRIVANQAIPYVVPSLGFYRLGVVRLPAPSVDVFLAAVTLFANGQLAGTLAATVFVDPATTRRRERSIGRAVSDLRYGTVGLNEWAVFAASLGCTTWGAFPGHTPQAIGSGTGTVMNAFRLPTRRNPSSAAAR